MSGTVGRVCFRSRCADWRGPVLLHRGRLSPMYKKFMTCVLSLPIGLTATALSAQSVGSSITLDQAVQRVQAETDGKVLSAEPRRIGRREEYRIKVLTPAGHVRVIVVSSEAGKATPAATQSARRPPGRHTDG